MKSLSTLSFLLILITITFIENKDHPHKKEERHNEKKGKKSKKTEEKNYIIKTQKTEEEMSNLFSDSTLRNLKEREKKTKEEKKIDKELSKITKSNIFFYH